MVCCYWIFRYVGEQEWQIPVCGLSYEESTPLGLFVSKCSVSEQFLTGSSEIPFSSHYLKDTGVYMTRMVWTLEDHSAIVTIA